MVKLSKSMRNAPALNYYKEMVQDRADAIYDTDIDPSLSLEEREEVLDSNRQDAEDYLKYNLSDDALLKELQRILAQKFFNGQKTKQQNPYIRQQYPVSDIEVEMNEMYNDPNYPNNYNLDSNEWR